MSVFDSIKNQLNVKSEETPPQEPITTGADKQPETSPVVVNDRFIGQNVTVSPVADNGMFKHQGNQLGLVSSATTDDNGVSGAENPAVQSKAPGLDIAKQVMAENPELAGQQTPVGPDWSQGFENIIRGEGYDKSIKQSIIDYNKWAQENGKDPLDAFTIFPLLQRYDSDKSIKQNEIDEKKAKRQETYAQIGNVLGHIGNLVGTIMGAPNQNIETPDWTERKRRLDAYTMQLRRQGANDMYGMLLKDRADQRAAETAKVNNDYRIMMTEAAKNKDKREEELALLQQERLRAQVAGDEARARQYDAEIKKKEAEINRINELLPYEKKRLNAQSSASYASANASNARATGTKEANKDWLAEAAEWEKLKPEDFKTWSSESGIETKKQGTKVLDNKAANRIVTKMRAKYGSLDKARKNRGTMPGVKGGGNNRKMPGVK